MTQNKDGALGMTKSQRKLLEIVRHRIERIGDGKKTDHWVPGESTIATMNPREIYDILLGWSNEAIRLHQAIGEIKSYIEALE